MRRTYIPPFLCKSFRLAGLLTTELVKKKQLGDDVYARGIGNSM